MTVYDTQEQEETLRPLDVLETRLIEADIEVIPGASGNPSRVYDDGASQPDEADVVGWTVYGDVYIGRDILPVCGHLPAREDDPDHAEHRRHILEMIADAYAAGRAA